LHVGKRVTAKTFPLVTKRESCRILFRRGKEQATPFFFCVREDFCSLIEHQQRIMPGMPWKVIKALFINE